MLPDDAWIDRVTQTACHHVAEGYLQYQAIDLAIQRHADELRGRRGLGQTQDPSLIQEAQAEAKSISSIVSPWLWVLSVGGFLMGMVSKYEISKMYGSYKRMKQRLT